MRSEQVGGAPAPRGRRWAIALQVLVSLAVLALLLREADPRAVAGALTRVSWAWLALAMVAKAAALTLHEFRLWWLLRAGHACSLRKVLGIGFLSGLVNVILPIRIGDVLAMVLLTRERKVPGPVAVSAVVLVAVLEAAALGLFLVVIFGTGLVFWEQSLGSRGVQNAFSTVALATLLGVCAVVGLGILGRLVDGRRSDAREEEGITDRLRRALAMVLEHTGGNLGRAGALLSNGLLALADAGLFLASYAILVRALDLPVPSAWTAAGVVMALSSVASLVLPPSLGAGTAASSVIALGLLGVDEPTALAYAALVWLAGNLPVVVLGLPPALARLGGLAELMASAWSRSGEPDPPTA